ncbi:MAG: UDP-N-acetylmuramyl-tripeptide synthetase, partial [Chloroflexi bacterium]|nr:UDP-N-acetylmuramyl-tripeptide synthetase [Chloroflexota bacterium]
MVTLQHLLAQVPIAVHVSGDLPDVAVDNIAFDSRQVTPGTCFVALVGNNQDGHRFIPDAVSRGAVAVVGSRVGLAPGVPYVQVEDTRPALAFLSAALYDFPARKLTVIGVTGTDGKTTTSSLIYAILRQAGYKAGMVSTVSALIGDEVVDTGFHVTTPEAPDIQRYLHLMVQAGLTHVVLESTSHGLAQHRVTGCEFDIGVVTNITHEHLDYHGSYAAYRESKGRLFTSLAETAVKPRGNPRLAVLNRDDQAYEYLHSITRVAQTTYSLAGEADLCARQARYGPDGVSFVAAGPGFEQPVHSRLIGAFNVSNCLAA